MSEADYGVSYIASAPEELRVGDAVEVIDDGKISKSLVGKQGFVVDKGVDGYYVKVRLFDGDYFIMPTSLRNLHDTISFENASIDAKYFEDSDNVKAFKAILNEMAETYKAKDATYGNCYQDGFTRFGAVQLVSRMYEKYCRIENLLVHKADNKVPDESVLDTLTDLSVQCICLRMILQKNDFENVN